MGGCQNHGPFLGHGYNTAPSIQGTPKGTIILTTTHVATALYQPNGAVNPLNLPHTNPFRPFQRTPYFPKGSVSSSSRSLNQRVKAPYAVGHLGPQAIKAKKKKVQADSPNLIKNPTVSEFQRWYGPTLEVYIEPDFFQSRA